MVSVDSDAIVKLMMDAVRRNSSPVAILSEALENLPLAIHLLDFDLEKDTFAVTNEFLESPKATLGKLIAEHMDNKEKGK